MSVINPHLCHDLKLDWLHNQRWQNVRRPYQPEDVLHLRGNLRVEHTLAQRGAAKLWAMLSSNVSPIAFDAATSAQQAPQLAANGSPLIYVNRTSGSQTEMVRQVERTNEALMLADQNRACHGLNGIDYFAPLMARGETSLGENAATFEQTKQLIKAGAAAIQFDDRLKGAIPHRMRNGTVIVATRNFINQLVAARLAADAMGVTTLLAARTVADQACHIAGDIDERDRPFLQAQEIEGRCTVQGGLNLAIARGLAYAPYVDIIWFETASVNLDKASRFARAIHAKYPNKAIAYSSTDFSSLSAEEAANLCDELSGMGYAIRPNCENNSQLAAQSTEEATPLETGYFARIQQVVEQCQGTHSSYNGYQPPRHTEADGPLRMPSLPGR